MPTHVVQADYAGGIGTWASHNDRGALNVMTSRVWYGRTIGAAQYPPIYISDPPPFGARRSAMSARRAVRSERHVQRSRRHA